MTPTPAHDTVAALLLALLASALGNLLGQLVLILGLSFLGALIALSRTHTERFWPHGAVVLGRGMALAFVVGGLGSAFWARWLGDLPYAESIAAISFLVGLRTEWALAKMDAWFGGAA